MDIIFSKEILVQLVNELKKTNSDLQIISAFCKEQALAFIQERVSKTVKNKRLLVRFTLADIVSGATDIGIYKFCKENGWDLYIQFNIHAKTYIFDRKRCLVGSANTTNKGFGLTESANIEISAIDDISSDDIKKIDNIFSTATKLDDILYAQMLQDIENTPKAEKNKSLVWNPKILSKIKSYDIKVLFSYEFPSTPLYEDIDKVSVDFLNFTNIDKSDEILKSLFLDSKAYKWLIQTLTYAKNNELYFGTLTKKMHDTIISDPAPYRKDIKKLLTNLLSWVERYAKNIVIDRPQYSQRIRLI